MLINNKLKLNIFPMSSHLLQVSYWPLMGSVVGLGLTCSGVYWWHQGVMFFFFFKFVFLLFMMKCWWSDIFLESKLGAHTSNVLGLLRVGMLLFILSEMMFFFSFFWAYFHSCLGPASMHGLMWPPLSFKTIIVDSFSMPLLKTMLLMSSGASVTCAHGSLINRNQYYKVVLLSLIITLILGFIFLVLQVFEYSNSLFSFNSCTYGSCFFMLTGFHGLHVTMGLIFLFVCLYRFKLGLNYKKKDMVSFECASWYWHFVDVVWLFLFMFVYLIYGTYF